MRQLLVSITLLAFVALLTADSASAAPRTTCTLDPVDGSAVFDEIDDIFGGADFRATWMATANCSDPGAALHGQTVEVRQMAQLHRMGKDMVRGGTVLGLVYGADNRSEPFHGQLKGSADCSAGAICDLELDIRASSQRARLSGHESLRLNHETGEMIAFMPPSIVIEFTGAD